MAGKKKGKKDVKQPALPGMRNRKLQDLHEAALEYAACRDKRIEAQKPEIDAKASLMRLMHKHKRTVYKYGPVSITLTVEKEKIKVVISSRKDDEEEAEVGDSGFEQAEDDAQDAANEAEDSEDEEEETEES